MVVYEMLLLYLFFDQLSILVGTIALKMVVDQVNFFASVAVPFFNCINSFGDAQIEGKHFFVLVDEWRNEEIVSLKG